MKQYNSILFVIIGLVGIALATLIILQAVPAALNDTRPINPGSNASETKIDPDLTLVGFADDQTMIELWEGLIENPSTGDKQSVRVYVPQGENLPAVIMIPGGVGSGAEFEKQNGANPSDALTVAQAGFVTVVYDPLARGESDGEINFQGFDDQDGLSEVIKLAKNLPSVDENNLGLASFSYGVTAAAGVLARYPELGLKFWSDWEGPSSRSYTNPGCTGTLSPDRLPTPGAFPCEANDHWSEREAAEFIKTAQVEYYWRIQQIDDHVQDTYGHTVEMINNAIANANIKHVLLNDMSENTAVTATTIEPVKNGPELILYTIPHLQIMAGI